MSETPPRAYPATGAHGVLRDRPEDFQVRERLGFEPSGAGEHILLYVRKIDANTDWLAGQLARFAGVAKHAVGYAGRKDRHALAEQWFSVHLAGRAEPDWAQFAAPGCAILQHHRHSRKLRRGALRNNAFRILIRAADGDWDALQERARLLAYGVPNYFGPQRFGLGNLERAQQWFAGRRKLNRNQRSLALSAARSWLFNQVLASRVERGDWNRAQAGDVLELKGSHSYFLAECINEALVKRVEAFDVHPTGPLWGRGELPSRGAIAELERALAEANPMLARGLEQAGLKQERRALRLCPDKLHYERLHNDVFGIAFELPAGGYATAILREWLDYQDASLQNLETVSR